jgi:L-2,4-diaminobutyrate transaminase
MNHAASIADLEAMDRRTLMHASTDLRRHANGTLGTPRIVESGNGIRIRDSNGVELIDAFAGLYCVNVGYGRSEIVDRIHEQGRSLAYYHTYAGHSHRPVIELAQRIIDLAPAGMSRVFFGMSGSDANETQVKLVWYYQNILGRPKKRKLISRLRGYHGSGIMSGSLTGLPLFHAQFNLPLADVKHTATPHWWREAAPGMSEREFSAWCAARLEELILHEGPDTVAAFIGEPVLGTGGIIPPPDGYWDAIQNVLAKYDVLLIADEVITAFGRLGCNFGCAKYGIRPDLITVAKGLTSGYLPLSGVIVGQKVWDVLDCGAGQHGAIGHGWTYSAHPLCATAGLANLDILEREGIVQNAGTVGDYFQKRLRELFANHEIVGEARGAGLLGALEFAPGKDGGSRFPAELGVGVKVAAACLANGMIARAMPHGDILGFAPPLIVTLADVDDILDRTRRAVDSVRDALHRDGQLKT